MLSSACRPISIRLVSRCLFKAALMENEQKTWMARYGFMILLTLAASLLLASFWITILFYFHAIAIPTWLGIATSSFMLAARSWKDVLLISISMTTKGCSIFCLRPDLFVGSWSKAGGYRRLLLIKRNCSFLWSYDFKGTRRYEAFAPALLRRHVSCALWHLLAYGRLLWDGCSFLCCSGLSLHPFFTYRKPYPDVCWFPLYGTRDGLIS